MENSENDPMGQANSCTETKLNDAVVFGVLDPDLLAKPLKLSISNHGANTKPGRWRPWETTVGGMLSVYSHHEPGQKDGKAFVCGPTIDGQRRANAVPAAYMAVLDLDVGVPLYEMHDKIAELGWFCLIYTTFSDGKDVSEISKEAVAKFLGGEQNPSVEQVKSYLTEVKRYRPDVLEGAEILSTDHTANGIVLKVRHQKMEKFRLVFVLEEPFVVAERGRSQQQALQEWRERLTGLSNLLGAYSDRATTDISRLFYTARHPAGSKSHLIEVIAGRALKIEEMPRVEVGRDASGVYEQALRGDKEYRTSGLLKFLKKFGPLFDAAEFFRDNDPDGYRGPTPSGVGHTHRCPNCENHTAGDDPEDKGFYCVNGTDSPSGQAIASCRHDACQEMDRADFIDLVAADAGITSADELEKWVPELVDDEKPAQTAGDTSKHAAYRNIAEVNRAVQSIAKGDKDAGQFVAICLGMSTAIGPTQKDDLRKQIAAVSDISIATLKKEEKAGLAKLAAEDEFLDDDTMKELMALNKEYAIVTLGDKVKIMQRQKRGEAPLFRSRDDFNFLMANRRVKQQDAAGNAKWVCIALPWSQWKDRREYDRVVFEPPPVDCPENWCNTWSGFPINGVSGDWSLLRGHIFENICLGNQGYFDWLMTWMADIVQHPGDKKGSCVVIKGKKGAGKSNPFDWLRKLLGEAMALKVSQREHIVGQFNAHQQGKLLLVCEEALWAGDKAVEGVLKDLITSDEMMMTPKGIDSVKVSNHMRLALISNESWVCPAGLEDERRFFVLHCGDARISDTKFFGQVKAQMKAGGLQAMMHELMTWQPTMFENGWNTLRKPPVTPWLKEQGEHGLSAAHLFVEHLVETLEELRNEAKNGTPGKVINCHYYRVGKPMTHDDPPEEIGGLDFSPDGETTIKGSDLQAEFNAWAKEYGIANRGNKGGAGFAETLEKDFGIKRTHTRQGKVYVFPSIVDLRVKLGHVDAPKEAGDSETPGDSDENDHSHAASD